MVKKFYLFFMLFAVTALLTCSKEENPMVEDPIVEDPANVDPGTPYNNNFDWETTTELHISYAGNAYDIPMFNYNVVAETYATESALKDVRKVDGWRLVYNWFLPKEWGRQTSIPMMLFYNVYRGKFKLCYYYIGSNTTNGHVLFSLVSEDDETSIFNLNDIITDPQAKAYSNTVSESSNSKISESGVGLNNATWYVFEWDASYYDPNLNPGERFALVGQSVNTQNVTLNGDIYGNVNGKIVSTSKSKIQPGDNIANAIAGGTTSVLTSMGKDKLPGFFTKLSEKSSGVISTLFSKLASDNSVKAIASTLAGPIGGIVGKGISFLLGKIFPGKETTTVTEQSVQLKVSLKQSLTGCITTPVPVKNLKFEIPTKKLSENSYFGKYGLFRFTEKPTVGVKESFIPVSSSSGTFNHLHLLTWMESSNSIIEVNPGLLEVADVTFVMNPVYVQNPVDLKIPMDSYGNLLNGFILDADAGHKRVVNSQDIIYTYILTNFNPSSPTMLPKQDVPKYSPYQNVKVLLNLKVAPKDGSDPILINQLIEPEYVGSTIFDLGAY